MQEIYQAKLQEHLTQSKKLQKADRSTAILRFFIAAAAAFLFYQYFNLDQVLFLIGALLTATAFFLLIKRHQKVRSALSISQSTIEIIEKEIDFLENGSLSFEDGKAFIQPDHPYSYDLDIFGPHSLYQTLNRTHTIAGKRKLAESLEHILPAREIKETQQAIEELTSDLHWRLLASATAGAEPDTDESYHELISWSQLEPANESKIRVILSYLLPAATLVFFVLYLFGPAGIYGNITGMLFLVNLGFFGSYAPDIKKELNSTTKIERKLKQYAKVLLLIEQKSFESKNLIALRNRLSEESKKASEAILELSLLFGRLEHITNVFASPLLNGSILYHVHVLRGLSNWRKEHAIHVTDWLDVIGEMEKYLSLANFHYNNPAFVFPEINEQKKIQFEEIGHPLIPGQDRVTNDISFENERFFILTGSNMSGKSTFLRTLGINMILAGIGAPVNAKSANVHPLPVFVSMRLSDSLTDSESYFYAEVKRLRYIMDQLDSQPAFVLLDEILRGTNSDDKQDGTIKVIRKLAAKEAFGGIATHDLEVCNVASEFPEVLTNKRFEVSIEKDELVFDYKLQDGICENKSASFIMKKMGVI